jgi:hypothetical protein
MNKNLLGTRKSRGSRNYVEEEDVAKKNKTLAKIGKSGTRQKKIM